MRTIPRWVDDYATIPFVHGGRTRTGADCWGIVRMVLAERAGVEVPEFDGMSFRTLLRTASAIRREMRGGDWIRIEDAPREFDVAPMLAQEASSGKELHLPVHLGVMVNDAFLLHSEEVSGPACVKLSDPDVSGRVLHPIFRHKSLIK